MEKGKALLAGGCFWCMVPVFDQIEGVRKVVAGYTGGEAGQANYEEISRGGTGHFEAVQIIYDPSKVSYEKIIKAFFDSIDPTDPEGQFSDRGTQYTTAVFYYCDRQKESAEKIIRSVESSGKYGGPVVTKVLAAGDFYPAEEYHQGYYKKNPEQYSRYKEGSGRGPYLRKMTGKEKGRCRAETLREKLTPLQYEVTMKGGTEKPFDNAYWDNVREGIYVDLISGDVLFSSTDKFDSGTGWPSFTKTINPGNIIEKEDRSLSVIRTELRSRSSGSHLGHVFSDGPGPAGRRYCVNSAALRFIAKKELDKKGYGEYGVLFES